MNHGLDDWVWIQRILASFVLLTLGTATFKHLYKDPLPFIGWIYYLVVASIIVNVMFMVMLEHRFDTLRKDMLEDKVEFGLEAGEALKTITMDEKIKENNEERR